QEETIKRLIEQGKPIRAEIVSELIKNYKWQNNYNEKIIDLIENNEIKSNDVIVTTENEKWFNYILSGIEERYNEEFFNTYKVDSVYYIVLKGENDDTYYSDIQKVNNLEGKGVYEYKDVLDSRLMNIGIGY